MSSILPVQAQSNRPATQVHQDQDSTPEAIPQPENSTTTADAQFIATDGDRDPLHQFQSYGAFGQVGFASHGLTIALPFSAPMDSPRPAYDSKRGPEQLLFQVIQLDYLGSRSNTRITGIDPLLGTITEWSDEKTGGTRSNITRFAGVQYRNLYDGIDVRYEGTQQSLKSTFLVQPKSNPGQIRWRYRGFDSVALDAKTGDLSMRVEVPIQMPVDPPTDALTRNTVAPIDKYITTTLSLIERTPIAWQQTSNGRIDVPIQFILTDDGELGFDLGAYDASLPLIIDPTIDYNITFGGSQQEDINDIAYHQDGSVVITGWTASLDFGTIQGTGTTTGFKRVFVSKRVAGTGVQQWTTYFGGNADSIGYGIAVLSNGNIVVSGSTQSGT
jgi:large repetitive protein